jgi:hypothetical protein
MSAKKAQTLARRLLKAKELPSPSTGLARVRNSTQKKQWKSLNELKYCFSIGPTKTEPLTETVLVVVSRRTEAQYRPGA